MLLPILQPILARLTANFLQGNWLQQAQFRSRCSRLSSEVILRGLIASRVVDRFVLTARRGYEMPNGNQLNHDPGIQIGVVGEFSQHHQCSPVVATLVQDQGDIRITVGAVLSARANQKE